MEELSIIKHIAREAGDIVLTYYRNQNFEISLKSHEKDFLTSADQAADNFIQTRLKEHFPEDTIVTEESDTGKYNYTGRCRLVDPIDGTRAFVEGNDMFAVFIGLAIEGVPSLGVMHFPVEDELYYAQTGTGAYLERGSEKNIRLQVSNTTIMSQATASYSEYIKYHNMEGVQQPLYDNCKQVEINKGRALFGRVAQGKLDIYVYQVPDMGPRDVCAPAIIIQEAGGHMTYEDGTALILQADRPKVGMLCSNGYLHNQLCEMLVS